MICAIASDSDGVSKMRRCVCASYSWGLATGAGDSATLLQPRVQRVFAKVSAVGKELVQRQEPPASSVATVWDAGG